MNEEVNRCLLCRNAKCTAACPVHTDVPAAMRLVREGKEEEAGALLFANNPMTAFTSYVCDWKKFCYGHCILNAKKEPIRWYEIEQELSSDFLKNYHPVKVKEALPFRIAIVGSGPAGMSAAVLLAQQGYAVEIFDNHEKMGGVLRYGIPSFRLDKTPIDSVERILSELGVIFHSGVTVGKDITVSQMAQKYDKVIVASGAVKSRRLRIPGEDQPHVHCAIEYLEYPEAVKLGKKVIVIGGGNVAMDAARTACRAGSETAVYYRKTFENMPANPLEVEEAIREGVRFEVFKAPVEIKSGTVVFADCVNETDESGKPVTRILPGAEQEAECHDLIIAVGESIDLSVFGETVPELNDWHYPVTDQHGNTSLEKVMIAGDLNLGASTVVEAVADARRVVSGILEECKQKEGN